MACSDLAVLLAAVVCVLCATPAALAQTVKIYWDCSPNNYSAGSAYDTSLRGMLKNVVAAAVSGGGYANDVAAGKAAYGLAICYTDALPGVCSLCLGMAAGNLSLACPLAASAAMMYNNCLLRYADAPFLALPDMTQEFSFYNPNMTSAGDAVQFSAALNRLMDRLAPAASAGAATAASSTRGGQRFAFGQTNITSDDSLYGFVQCVDDLSSDDCRRCLQSLAATLPMTRGGRAYTLTCYTRFEVNPIYIPPHVGNLVVAAAPPAELPDAKHSKSRLRLSLAASSAAAVLLVMSCVVAVVVKRGKWQKFQLLMGMNSKQEENIEQILENYGSLAPKRYRYSQLKDITRSFSEKLGEGGYGMVYKGTLPDGHSVAVKFLHDLTRNGEDFVNEVVSIRRTSHVNVVTLVGFCLEGSKRALVYEFMPNGSLDKFIYAENSEVNLGWDKLYEIAVGIARGLEYLHRGCNTRIIHFDIKPHNILLDHEFVPKIADFGLAMLCNPKESYLSMAGMRGTIGFIAPEVFSRRFGVVSTKSDVYSYGMMLLEMVGGRKNLQTASVVDSDHHSTYFPDWIYRCLSDLGSLQSFDMDHETEQIARKMASIGLWCIQVSPSSRPTMSRVLEMFERSADQLEIPPKHCFFTAIQEGSSEQELGQSS